ncbi:ABC transporter ATP-binding protein [Hydrogenophaga sp. NFH-34]|uniref:ABC transporter ATP-binding protein n=1 Tax=Hydrogenophaga sp. NFH-34 TaxID=2744446 RepID=UPI001F33A063|nr:ABC transporter ATP-binding protein [Hydrogenophaga sp. NFH-34]
MTAPTTLHPAAAPVAPAAPTEVALKARGLSVVFGGLTAVDALDLDIRSHSIHAIIGPNGAGKTTAVNALSGFQAPTRGQVWIGTATRPRWSAHQMAQAGLARTFQNIRLFGGMTVLETVLVGAHKRFGSTLPALLWRSARARAEEQHEEARARELIRFVGLPDTAVLQPASSLSYGNQRRVEIARALMSSPAVLLLDEPLAGMNVSEKAEVSALIRAIRQQGTAVLLIEHDMDVIRSLAERVTVMHRGRKLTEGSSAEVLADQRVQDAYLGKVQ